MDYSILGGISGCHLVRARLLRTDLFPSCPRESNLIKGNIHSDAVLVEQRARIRLSSRLGQTGRRVGRTETRRLFYLHGADLFRPRTHSSESTYDASTMLDPSDKEATCICLGSMWTQLCGYNAAQLYYRY